MIDHVLIRVSDVEKSRKFYEQIFKPLSYVWSFGEDGVFHSFDIQNGLFEFEQTEKDINPVHVAFRVKSKELIEDFYKSALEAGAKDNGAPGPRTQYTPTYYSCFVLDPDGHNIEVMMD
tara:strand:- start:15609 stop:15965 length:357 start_codon:yes stop_codon:yes gene_type:complete